MADPLDMAATLKALVLTVGDLAGRVEDAADLSALLKSGAIPDRAFTAWIVPTGLRPRGEGEAGAGYFIQTVDEHFAVVIAQRVAGDATGAKGMPKLNQLVWAIISAVCGSDDEEALGVFRLVGGRLHGVSAGLLTYVVDFAIPIQIRNL